MARAVGIFLDHVAVERGASAHTIAAYRRDLARYVDFCARRDLTDPAAVDTRTVEDFVAELAVGDADHAPLAAASVARTLAAVRSFHKFLVRESTVADDPAAVVRPPRTPARLPKAIRIDEVAALITAAGASGGVLGLRDTALLEFLYATGARVSEAVGLDVDDWPEADGVILLRGKGGKERIVPVGGMAQEAMAAYLVRGRPELSTRGRFTPALFLNARGQRMTRQNAFAVLSRLAEQIGLGTAVSPHTLRHSFATHLLDGGADVRVVQELLGHASVAATQIYTMVTPHRLAEEYAGAHPRARSTRP